MHYYFIEFIYIHDYMGLGYVGAACCTILRYFPLINVFNVLIIILKFSIKKKHKKTVFINANPVHCLHGHSGLDWTQQTC